MQFGPPSPSLFELALKKVDLLLIFSLQKRSNRVSSYIAIPDGFCLNLAHMSRIFQKHVRGVEGKLDMLEFSGAPKDVHRDCKNPGVHTKALAKTYPGGTMEAGDVVRLANRYFYIVMIVDNRAAEAKALSARGAKAPAVKCVPTIVLCEVPLGGSERALEVTSWAVPVSSAFYIFSKMREVDEGEKIKLSSEEIASAGFDLEGVRGASIAEVGDLAGSFPAVGVADLTSVPDLKYLTKDLQEVSTHSVRVLSLCFPQTYFVFRPLS